MERFGAIGYDLCKNSMKKDWKKSWKIKSLKTWLQEILIKFVDLIDSYINKEHNPNAFTHAAAERPGNQTWKIWQETQFWKRHSKAIQVSKPIPLASSSIIGRIPITNLKDNLLKLCTEVPLLLLFCIIVSQHLGIFIAYC